MSYLIHTKQRLIASFNKLIKHSVMPLALAGLMATATSPTLATDIQISQEPVAPRGDYNILLFENLRMDLTGKVGVLYDDNVDNAEDDEESGTAVIPRLSLGIDWPITPHVRLGTGLDIGYRAYVSGEGEDNFILSESGGGISTSLNADVFIGNGVLRLSESFRRDADTLDVLRSDSTDDYARNRNTLKARYTVPVSEYITLIAEAERRDTWVSPDQYEYQDNNRNILFLNALYQMNPKLQVGPYARWEKIDYDDTDQTTPLPVGPFLVSVSREKADRTTPEVGMSFLYQREAGFTVEGSAGYEFMDVDPTNPFITDEEDGFTGDISCIFSTSRKTQHSLRVSHDRKQALTSLFANYSEETSYSYAVSSNIMPDVTVSGDLTYLDIRESDRGENADIYRVGVGTGYQFTRKLNGRIRYEYVKKNSDRSGSDYDRNQVRLTLSYDF